MFNFEKLDVYKCAIDFLALSAGIIEELPRGSGVLADQLKRAALSVPLNIAEAMVSHCPPMHDAYENSDACVL